MKKTILSLSMLSMLAVGLLLALTQTAAQAQVIVPEGFTVEVYAGNVPMPFGLSFDSQGNLYVAHDEARSGRIHKISPGGVSVSLFGPAINDPDAVAVDSVDYIFVGSEQGLYRVAPDGTSRLFTSDFMGNNTSLAIDHAGLFGEKGSIFVSNARSAYDIVKVKSDGRASVFVSNSDLHITFGLAFDDIGYLYAAETSTEVQDVRGVYRIAANGEVSFFVGLTTPFSVAFNKIQRKLYVGDLGDSRIYKVSLDGEVSVFAENIQPWGLTFGPDGSLYVSDRSTSPHRILKISDFPPPIPTIPPQATIDLDPDVFEVEVDPDQEPEEPEEEFLRTSIEPPAGVSAADIDVTTVTLSVNGTTLATAEDPLLVDNVLSVLFRLNLTNVSTILGLDVTEVEVDESSRKC